MLRMTLLLGGLALLAATTIPIAFADVTTQQHLEVEAGGVMSFLSAGGTVTTSISGDRSRSESRMESRSSLMGSLGGDMDTVNIMRLDRDLVWQLQPQKQRYSEMSFEQMRTRMQQATAQFEEMQQSSGTGALPVSESDCQWSDPKLEVQETGERQRFANVKAEQHIITVQETCAVPEHNQTCVLTWKLENWLARRMPGDDETEAFRAAVAEKLGVDQMMSGMQASSMAMMSMFGEGWEDVLDEAAEIEGFPVKTVMQLEMGGENCTAASGQPIAMDDIWASAMDTGFNAAANSASAQAGAKIGEEASEAMGDSVGGSIGGAAVGAASREVIGGLFSKFRKKKKEPEPAPAEAPGNPAAGSVALFRIAVELTAVSDDDIPADRFEVPAGWQRIDP